MPPADAPRAEQPAAPDGVPRAGAGILVAAATLANIVLAFVQQWYVLTRLGPGRETDALAAGMIAPQIVLTILSGSLVHVLVPVLTVEDDATRRQTAWTSVHAVALLFALLAGLLAGAAPYWVPVIVPGFDAATTALAVRLVRIQVVSVVFAAVAAVLWALHRSQHRLVWAELCNLIATVAGLGVVAAGLGRYGVTAVAWATVLRASLPALLLAPALGRYLAPRFGTPTVREVRRRVVPLLAGAAYFKSDLVVDRFLASMAPPGTLSLLNTAQALYSAAQQVLNRAVVVPVVPALATAAHRREWGAFRRLVRERTRWMLGVTGAAYGLLLVAGQPLLALVFRHGRFDERHLRDLWLLLVLLGGVWIAGAMGQVVSSGFYAAGETSRAVRIAALSFTVGIALKVGGSYYFGVWGVAGAASLYYIQSLTWLGVALARFTAANAAERAPAEVLVRT